MQGRADSIRLAQKRLSVARGESWEERRPLPHSRFFSEGPGLQRLASGTPVHSNSHSKSHQLHACLAAERCTARAAAEGLARGMRSLSGKMMRRVSLGSLDSKDAYAAPSVVLVASAGMPAERKDSQGKLM